MGFVAEDPAFPNSASGWATFIGPAPDVMRRLGDKIGAKLLAEEKGGTRGRVERRAGRDRRGGSGARRRDRLSLMIKATAGGGGRGIRRVENADEVATAFERARDEARRSFGDATVFMERVVQDARHVEVQVIADAHGNAWALGVRDCSVQRRNQKLIEESASPVLAPDQSQLLADAAVRLVKAAGYRNAGTVEFLYQPAEQKFAFLEVNTRLQVEHPVTEATSGADLVKLQILVASGEPLPGEQPAERGHAIEARLNTEDPQRGFAPAPGRIVRLRFPSGPGIRVDSGFGEGDEIPSAYDSMIAKIIAWGADRPEALARLRRALAETSAVVEGGATNRTFLLELLQHPDVIAGTVDTGWLDRLGTDPLLPAHLGDVAVLTAAIGRDEQERSARRVLRDGVAGVRTPATSDGRRLRPWRAYRGRGPPGPGDTASHRRRGHRRHDHLGEFDRRGRHDQTQGHALSERVGPPRRVDGIAHQSHATRAGSSRSCTRTGGRVPVSGCRGGGRRPVVVVSDEDGDTLTHRSQDRARGAVAGNVQVAAGAARPTGTDRVEDDGEEGLRDGSPSRRRRRSADPARLDDMRASSRL